MRRLLLIACLVNLLILIALSVVVIVHGQELRRRQQALAAALPDASTSQAASTPPTTPQFTLTDSGGRTVTQDTFRGRCELVYFGYSFCPDICPTELGTQARLLKALGDDAAGVVPLFITIDPGRDTPAHLAQYVALFDRRIVGLTGSEAQVRAAATAFGAWYQRATPAPGAAPRPAGQYLMDHTSSTYLVDRQGRLVGTIDLSGPLPSAVAAIRACR